MDRQPAEAPPPCVLALLGASGDLCKRLLMPTLYNLACDNLLPAHFAVLGMSRDAWSTDEFVPYAGIIVISLKVYLS